MKTLSEVPACQATYPGEIDSKESIPGLLIPLRAQAMWPAESLELIPGLLKSLKIPSRRAGALGLLRESELVLFG
jgi:hypothetical protein